VIHPYKYYGTWVFDDDRVGLLREAFVAGADRIIDRMVENIPNADQGVTILFAQIPFPGHQFKVQWRREEGGGNVYYSSDFDIEGWLCPTLFKYFDSAPKEMFIQIKPLQS
jgi:hypothetical protein